MPDRLSDKLKEFLATCEGKDVSLTYLRNELRIDPKCQLVVSVGHVEPRKGFCRLIDALAILRQSNSQVRLAVLGSLAFDPHYYRRLMARVRSEGLDGMCSFMGQQPPRVVSAWLSAADVFALASRNEGCCNAVLEALASGIPVVTTPVGDNARYVRDSHNGFIVPTHDVTPLVDALQTALARSWDREAISLEVTSRNWEHVAREVLGFFGDRCQ